MCTWPATLNDQLIAILYLTHRHIIYTSLCVLCSTETNSFTAWMFWNRRKVKRFEKNTHTHIVLVSHRMRDKELFTIDLKHHHSDGIRIKSHTNNEWEKKSNGARVISHNNYELDNYKSTRCAVQLLMNTLDECAIVCVFIISL